MYNKRRTSLFHPQTNMTESVNRSLKAMIAAYVGEKPKNWDKYLPEFRFALNSAVHETTGVTPAELNLARLLQGLLHTELSPHLCDRNTPVYTVAKQLDELHKLVNHNMG